MHAIRINTMNQPSLMVNQPTLVRYKWPIIGTMTLQTRSLFEAPPRPVGHSGKIWTPIREHLGTIQETFMSIRYNDIIIWAHALYRADRLPKQSSSQSQSSSLYRSQDCDGTGLETARAVRRIFNQKNIAYSKHIQKYAE